MTNIEKTNNEVEKMEDLMVNAEEAINAVLEQMEAMNYPGTREYKNRLQEAINAMADFEDEFFGA